MRNLILCSIFITLIIKLVSASPTTLQPLPQNDFVETTTLSYYEEDTEILEEKTVAPQNVVRDLLSNDDVVVLSDAVGTTFPPPVPEVVEPVVEVAVQPQVLVPLPNEQIVPRQDDSEPDGDDEEEGGDDEEDEDQQNQGPPDGPPPPKKHLIPSKPGGLYKESANSTRPVKVPTITVQQQQAEAAAAATSTTASPSTSSTTLKYSRIRTTQKPKPTVDSIIKRRPSTPRTTTPKVLTFAEEFNLTNFFHTHTGPQGRADCECGKIPFKLENADSAGVNVYPWAIAIVRAGIFGGGRPHCGGTLINDRFVVTAVHCVLDLYPEDIQVWLTAHNSFQPIDNFVQSDRVVKKNVAEIIMHPNYNRRSHDNDVALLKLGTTVDISSSSYFTPICLAAADNTYAGLTARVVGWGSSSSGSNRFSDQRLCKEDVPVLSNDVCIRDTVHGDKITGNMMCAGLLTADRSQTCLGDAGSGLTIPNGGRYTLIGVVSWGYQNRVAYSPVVYAKVSGYSDWILHNTRDADWCIV